MGWTGNADMSRQVRLEFASKCEALDYANRQGLDFVVIEPKAKKLRTKSYSDNFSFSRKTSWTH
jgi:hypothetical protein